MIMVNYMSTRMDKYHNKEEHLEKRVNKNKKKYTEKDEADIESLSLTSNIAVLDTDTSNLDIEKIKEMLDEKYKRPARHVHLDFDDELDEPIEEDLENTKEYDLKKIIDEARKGKSSDYNQERFKKLRDTEYEILNSLNLNGESHNHDENLTEEEKTLVGLIKTIDENSSKKKTESNDEDNLLDDLLGDDNTEVLEPVEMSEITDEITVPDRKPTLVEELEKTKQLSRSEIMEKLDETEELKETLTQKDEYKENKEPVETTKYENTFYTGTLEIKESDLDDFKDLEKELKSGNIFIKILIIVIVLIVIAAGIYLLNKYLNLGLF